MFLIEKGFEAGFEGIKRRLLRQRGRIPEGPEKEKECLLNFSCLMLGTDKRATQAD